MLSTVSIGQYLPKSYNEKHKQSYVCKKPEKFNIDSLIKFTKQYNEDSAFLACCHHQLGVHFYIKKKDYFKSIKHNKLAKNIRQSYNDGLLWKSLRNLAFCYKKLNNYDTAVKYYESAINAFSGENIEIIEELQIRLAESLYNSGEYSRGKDIANNVINTSNKNTNIGKAYRILSDAIIAAEDSINYNLAVDYGKEAVKLSKRGISALNTLANAYNSNKEYEKAIEIYNEVFNKSIKKSHQANAFNNLATSLSELKQYDKSLKYLYKALKFNFNYYGYQKYNFNYASNYRNIANNYFEMGHLDSALFYFQSEIANTTNNFRIEDVFKNPNPTDTSLFIYSNPEMIQVLHLKAAAVYQHYQQNNNIKYLNLAHQTYQTLIGFHNILQQDISTENSRLFQSKNIVEYLERALEVAFTKQLNGSFDGEATFRLMEKNKATVLLQSMNEADALQFANLPDSLLEQEKDLKLYISEYKRRLNDAKINEDTITIINELEQTLFKNKEKYQRLIKTLENNYPKYYQLKYRQNQTTLSQVKNQLDEASALLEYFVGEKHIYILSIQKNKSRLYQIEKPTNWNKRLNDFVVFFKPAVLNRDKLHSAAQLNKFAQLSSYLYELLLLQPLNNFDDNIKELQIIPDAELNYLPFEVLLYKKTDTINELTFDNLPYLIKQKAIGYAYSANLWLDNLQTKPLNKPITYGGYASIYSGPKYTDLPKPRQQVEATAKMFDGIPYLGELATKPAFLEDNNNYLITQFAMHGVVNDTLPLNSHLVFTPTNGKEDSFKLYASDLYNKKLNTELAILNACNTGTGQLQKGEGVMSLSRAFTYAGCPSLMMSLWSIPDVSSANVLDDFFINLKNGATKNVALQQAKLKYLQTSEKTHPVYWAGLVAVGNMEALDLNNTNTISNWIYLLIAGLVITCVATFYTVKK